MPGGGRKPSLSAIVGVRADQRHLYAPDAAAGGHFRCLQSGKEIPFEEVNDDFCDCGDLSDEPSTGACGPDSVFYCSIESASNLKVNTYLLPSTEKVIATRLQFFARR